jgi:hypothetical protein
MQDTNGWPSCNVSRNCPSTATPPAHTLQIHSHRSTNVKKERRRGYYRNNAMGKMLGFVDGHVSVVHRGVSVSCYYGCMRENRYGVYAVNEGCEGLINGLEW